MSDTEYQDEILELESDNAHLTEALDREKLRSKYWDKTSVKLRARVKELETDNKEIEDIFDMQHKRDMDASKEWRTCGPGRELTLPDRGKLMLHVLDRAEAAEARVRELQDIAVLAEKLEQAVSEEREASLKERIEELEKTKKRSDAILARLDDKG